MALIFNLSNPTRTVLHAKSWLEVEKYDEPQTFFSLDWIELMAQWLRWGAVMIGSFPAGCWNILPTLFYDSSELIWTLIAKTDLHQHLSRHQNSLAIPANASQPQTAEHSNQKAYPITGPSATTYNGSCRNLQRRNCQWNGTIQWYCFHQTRIELTCNSFIAQIFKNQAAKSAPHDACQSLLHCRLHVFSNHSPPPPNWWNLLEF